MENSFHQKCVGYLKITKFIIIEIMSFFSIYREWITGIKCNHLTLLVNVTNSLDKLRQKKLLQGEE